MMSKGPIPEGTYHVRQLNDQRTSELSWAKRRLFGHNWHPGWRGGKSASGNNRIWLHPTVGVKILWA